MSDLKILVVYTGISIAIGAIIGLVGLFIKIIKKNTTEELEKEYDIRKIIKESIPYGYSDEELYNLLFANKEQKTDFDIK